MQSQGAEVLGVTEKAKAELAKILQQGEGEGRGHVRVGVVGGGCSGLSYKIDFGEPKEGDNRQAFPGGILLIDPKSSIYLKETVLDFQDGLQGKGFVFKNPNATNTCGCGESFSFS